MDASRREFLTAMAMAAGGTLLAPGCALASPPRPIVDTAFGKLAGYVNGAGTQVFKGIPFAAAPVGPRRFRPPERTEGWRGVRDALLPGPRSVQEPGSADGASPSTSEDCLYLDVWTPACDDGSRPVLFYIHGGAFVAGSGSSPAFDGSRLAREQDIVVVTINYRLGILGFPPFRLHGPETTNNLGVLDQIAALEWVRDNIEAFGGDPGNVTISGLSAGGWSVACLMTTARAAGLFHHANAQSAAIMTVISDDRQRRQTATILAELGLTSGRMKDLATAPAEDILRVQQKMLHAWERSEVALLYSDFLRPFTPLRDGILFDEHPASILARGGGADVPLFIGTTSQEIFPAEFRLELPWMRRWYKEESTTDGLACLTSPATAEAIWRGYGSIRDAATEAELAGAIRSDYGYRLPTVHAAEGHHRQAPTWTYLFTYPAPNIGISTHATDMMFWFGNLDDPVRSKFFFGRPAKEDEHRLSSIMRRDLAAFMRGEEAGWAAYDIENRTTRIYDLEPTVADDPLGEERALWEGVNLRVPS